jgi:peroxiredoxin
MAQYEAMLRRAFLPIVLVLSLCVCSPTHAAEPPRAEVFLSWIDLVETDRGWQVNRANEMGDWDLPLVEGDVLTQIEGQDAANLGPISLVPFLEDAISRKIKVTIERKGQPLQLEILLATEEEVEPERYVIGASFVHGPGGSGITILGTQPGGPAEKAGLQKNDMILAVDGKDVSKLGISDVHKLLAIDHQAPVKLRLLRGKTEFEVFIERVSTHVLYPEMEASARSFSIHKRGEPAPAFSLTDTQGRKVSLEDYRGRWVLLNIWGIWCGVCHFEIPFLKAWDKQYAGKVVVLSVDIDDKEDSLKRYLTRHPLPYEVLLGGEMDGPVGKSYNVRGAPLNVVIDPKGAVRYVEFGFEPASPTEPPPLESFLRSVVP